MIGAAMGEIRSWLHDVAAAWDRFWFCGRTGETLAVIRIATGVMLLYSHLVLAKDLMSFVGPDAWIDNVTAKQLHDGAFGVSDWARSYLWHIDNASLLWAHQALAITASALMAVGFLSRLTVPLAWFLNLMYVHRLTGALFGLDQIMTYSAMYLSLAPCGAVWSVDAWLRRQGKWSAKMRDRWLPANRSYVSTNVATRLFQIHVCVIYLFGGLAKARGEMWWDGAAVWFAVANYEYQSWDMTWMGRYPRLFSLLTHTTLFWEVFYCALVWPRLTRPIVLAMAVAVHGGIALFLGMITFGVMMIVANMIFVPPDLWRRLMGRGAHEKTPVKA